MPKRIALVSMIVVLPSLALAAVSAPGWNKAETDLKNDWKKKYPDEQILSVKKNGESSSRQEVIKVRIEYPFEVTAKQGGGEKVFQVRANYLSERGAAFRYTGISVGDVVDKTAQKSKPSKDVVKQIALKAFKEKHPEYDYENMKITDGRAGNNDEGISVFYESDVDRTDSQGKKITCKDGSFIIKKKTGDADWKATVLSDGKCF